MTDPGWALQKAVYTALIADADVLAALGGPHVYDHVPRKTETPYITFGQSIVRDWSSATDTAHEHVLTIHVWSTAAGRKEVAAVMTAVRGVLHDQALALDGHHLVNLRHEFSDIRREPDGDTLRGLLRLRAVTEPLGLAA